MKRLKDSEIEEFVSEWITRTEYMFEMEDVGTRSGAAEVGANQLRSMLRGERL